MFSFTAPLKEFLVKQKDELVEKMREVFQGTQNAEHPSHDSAPFVPEQQQEGATFSRDEEDNEASTARRGFFSMFSKLFENLADPTKSIRHTLTSFIGGVVDAIIGVLASLVKRVLHKRVDDMVDGYAGNTRNAFRRFVNTPLYQEEANSSHLPSFTRFRQQQAEPQQVPVPQQGQAPNHRPVSGM